MSDKETKTVNKVYNPDKACPGLDPGDPEAKSGTDQFPRVEKESRVLKISLWIGIPIIAIVIILWVLHNWFGYWIGLTYKKYDFADTQCRWMVNKLPLWLIGKGILKYNQGTSILEFGLYEMLLDFNYILFPIWRKDASCFLLKHLDKYEYPLKYTAWNAFYSQYELYREYYSKDDREKIYNNIARDIYDENRDISNVAIEFFWMYSKKDTFVYKYLKEAMGSENTPVIEQGIMRLVEFHEKKVKYGYKIVKEHKEAKKNVQLFIEILKKQGVE